MVGDVGFILRSIHSNYLTIMHCFRRLCDVALFTHHLRLWGPCSFRAYPVNRSVVSSFQVLPILSSFASLLNRSTVWNLSYPLCHSFNSSGGSVLLISSSILSSCQIHVEFFPFTVGVLSKLYHYYSFSILFNRSVVVIDPYHSLHTSFLPECLHVLLVHCNPFSYVFQPRRF